MAKERIHAYVGVMAIRTRFDESARSELLDAFKSLPHKKARETACAAFAHQPHPTDDSPDGDHSFTVWPGILDAAERYAITLKRASEAPGFPEAKKQLKEIQITATKLLQQLQHASDYGLVAMDRFILEGISERIKEEPCRKTVSCRPDGNTILVTIGRSRDCEWERFPIFSNLETLAQAASRAHEEVSAVAKRAHKWNTVTILGHQFMLPEFGLFVHCGQALHRKGYKLGHLRVICGAIHVWATGAAPGPSWALRHEKEARRALKRWRREEVQNHALES